MTTRLYIAPAAHGKTEAMLRRAQAAARALRSRPMICVPTAGQARSVRRRLGALGGAIGVTVLTFDNLYAVILKDSDQNYLELEEPVEYRLMRSVVQQLDDAGGLGHYHPVAQTPGFAAVARTRIAEMKNAQVRPDELMAEWEASNAPDRLRELGALYQAWQARLQAGGWADRAGMGWLAVEALDEGRACLPAAWSPLIFDGFDSLTGVQCSLLRALHAHHPGGLWITLTGDPSDRGIEPQRVAHRRFHQTRTMLESILSVAGEPLAGDETRAAETWQPALLHVQQSLFETNVTAESAAGCVEMIEASTRALEVREALRWIKERVVLDGIAPEECAIAAGDLAPYAIHIDQIAREFGLPIDMEDGQPLGSNPLVGALLSMLGVMLGDSRGQPALPRRDVIELWRSPYFDWSVCGIEAGDADRLDAAARCGMVTGGIEQWRVALRVRGNAVVGLDSETEYCDNLTKPTEASLAAAAQLLECFETWVAFLTPPRPMLIFGDFVRWLSSRLGESTEGVASTPGAANAAAGGLAVMRQARMGGADEATRDIAALRHFKKVLRDLLWAEEAVGSGLAVPYDALVQDLTGAIEAASYHPPAPEGAIHVANTRQMRGVPCDALALLGLAEGELPSRLAEDPFLRDADRRDLQQRFPRLQLSTDSAEREIFLDAITRPRRRLLLTRPRLAENGAPWEPSPYWDHVRALCDVTPAQVRIGQGVRAERAASVAELLEAHSQRARPDVEAWLHDARPGALEAVRHAARIIRERLSRSHSIFDGDLTAESHALTQRFGPSFNWSPSALETYRACGFQFLCSRVLRIEPQIEPETGVNVQQLGLIYHEILRSVYKTARGNVGIDNLLLTLTDVGEVILGDAPTALGFRVIQRWQQQRDEIVANVRTTLEVLAHMEGTPVGLEAEFGYTGPLEVVGEDGDSFRLRGRIDRIDMLADGSLRVIDYKCGVSGYDKGALTRGERLQIALYALAAERLLPGHLVAEGFYFSVTKAEESALSLVAYEGGPQGAMHDAVRHAWGAVEGARAGQFAPIPPKEGCPDFCPAASFCWHYRPGR